MMKRYIFLWTLYLILPPAVFGFETTCQAATIKLDTNQTYQIIMGFGGNGATTLLGVAKGQQVLEELVTDLNLALVRIPVTLSVSRCSSFDGYLAQMRGPGEKARVWKYAQALNRLGAEPLLVVWSLPSWNLDANRYLKSSAVADVVNLWTAIVYHALYDQGISFRYVEISNEPDGKEDTYISPSLYWQLVAALSAEWYTRNFPVRIVGPGTSHMANLSNYLVAMPQAAPSHFGPVSTHAWDRFSEASSFNSFLTKTERILNGTGLKLIVTEYGTHYYGDADYCLSPSPADRPEYALYVASMTHYFLSSNITTSMLIWDLYDMFHCADKRGTKVWGLRQSAAKNFSRRPHNFALQPFYRLIPRGAVRIGTIVENDPAAEILATSYKSPYSLVSVVINRGAVSRTVYFSGIPSQPAAFTEWREGNPYELTRGSIAGASVTLSGKSVMGIIFGGPSLPSIKSD